jgi:hypothetical protein
MPTVRWLCRAHFLLRHLPWRRFRPRLKSYCISPPSGEGKPVRRLRKKPGFAGLRCSLRSLHSALLPSATKPLQSHCACAPLYGAYARPMRGEPRFRGASAGGVLPTLPGGIAEYPTCFYNAPVYGRLAVLTGCGESSRSRAAPSSRQMTGAALSRKTHPRMFPSARAAAAP